MNRVVFSLAVLVAMAVAGGVLYVLTRTSAPAPASIARTGDEAVPEVPRTAEADDARRAGAARGARAPVVAPSSAAPAPAPAAPTMGTVRIDSDVAGAQVFIDRQFIGNAPVTARNIAPGTHRLNVDAPGYEGVAQTLEVEPGSSDVFIRLREVRLDASVAVVHEHRIGSCWGLLTATPRGIRYAAAEGGDSFEAPLADLDRFDLDYLEKSLRVQVRGGRRYDFTDPEGNADRLFVFHRDVDRARERLASGDPPAEE